MWGPGSAYVDNPYNPTTGTAGSPLQARPNRMGTTRPGSGPARQHLDLRDSLTR